MQVSTKAGIFFIVFFSLIVIAGPVYADIPGQISFQGQLTDLSGTPVTDGNYTMRFFLFNDEIGGSQVWNDPSGEEQVVPVVDGIYNVQLGSVHALTPEVFSSGDVWLEVKVYNSITSTWETLSPRQKITSAAYALRAGDADTLEDQTLSDLDIRYVKPGDADAVTSGMIAAGAVGSADVADNSLTAADLASGSVGTAEVADNSITYLDILDGPGSNLNADYLDGLSSSAFMPSSTDNWVNETGDIMTASTNTNVLKVDNNQTTGSGYAVYARTNAETGYAVAGFAMNTGNFRNRGGHFYAYGDNGQAVYGLAPDSGSGTNYGAYFEARSASGRGVYGESDGSYGRGVEGSATSSGNFANYGGYFTAAGAFGRGVYARATNTGNYVNYGGYFVAEGDGGVGVYGNGDEYGLSGSSINGDGIYAVTYAADEHAGYFYSSAGVGLNGAVVYARNYNSSGQGIALHAHNDYSTSTDAAAVLSNDGSGPLLKGFGRNSGEEEFRINNDGTMYFYNSDHEATVIIDPEEGSGGVGGQITLYDGDGTATILIDGDYQGDGRITTQELQITGGSDLSEQFDIPEKDVEIFPGMVVSIDPDRPGNLAVSRAAYDKKVAGIISGAGGIKSGMMMGQKGSVADGQYPVALTGRVYCQADASTGAIQPGDLLTTSDLAGHAMKVSDHSRANGAILGKAMTSLEQGSGLVLVLVSLQ